MRNYVYREDPIRMLRAIRFAGKLQFDIAIDTATPFLELRELIWNVASSRVFEEVLKLFFNGYAYANYKVLQQYQFFTMLFPQTKDFQDDSFFPRLFIPSFKKHRYSY